MLVQLLFRCSAREPFFNIPGVIVAQNGAGQIYDDVTWVSNRNINYTNVCTFKCRFCAFSKGPLSLNLRGAPYLVEMEEMQGLKAMSYGSAKEGVAEKFHVAPELLSELNPGQKFEQAGQKIVVPDVLSDDKPPTAAKIDVDKTPADRKPAHSNDQSVLVGWPPVTYSAASSNSDPANVGAWT